MMANFEKPRSLLREFKGDNYINGRNILSRTGSLAVGLGKRSVLVRDNFPGIECYLKTIRESLSAAGISIIGEIKGAAPNCPREDLSRISAELCTLSPDLIIGFGGGSTLDAIKSAEVLRTLGGSIEDYFGTGLVTKALEISAKTLTPFLAIQTAASSAAHLTKYSNITDVHTGQKKLVVDEAIIPLRALFDYEVSFNSPPALTADGALDGVAHALEVLYGAVGKPFYDKMEEVAYECIHLVAQYLPIIIDQPQDPEGREAIGLATDLGGYAIMIGGTNGGHLTSFSMVDILSHGRACAIMNPYYTVLFAPAIQSPLKLVGGIFEKTGDAPEGITNLAGRELGIAVARALITFEKRVNFPTTLAEVPGFNEGYIERALSAAKNPQLRMKLENMPVPLTAEMIDEYMGPVLQAARMGNLELIKNVA
jgi:alcohol dehydrogenase